MAGRWVKVLWPSQNVWTLKNDDLIFEQNWSDVDCCVQKTQLHHLCIRTKPKSLLWNHFLFKWKAESQWCQRPQFSIDPRYKQVCPPKGRKKIKITVIMYYVQFTQLPPPLGPPFFFIQSILTVKPCLFCENKAKSC